MKFLSGGGGWTPPPPPWWFHEPGRFGKWIRRDEPGDDWRGRVDWCSSRFISAL